MPDTRIPDLDLEDEEDERRERRTRWFLVGLTVLVLLAIGGVVWLVVGGNNASDQRDAAVGQSTDLAGQVVAACASGQLPPTDRLCAKAAEVAATPIPNAPGPAGRGIAGTQIVGDHLLVTYTDGATNDLGVVVGVKGDVGEQGRGIAGSTIVAGHLVLTYTDGTTFDVGQVVGGDGRVGDPGRGITSTAVEGGHLIIRYSDGTSDDLGPLPAGPAGPACPPGSSLQQVTYADGRIGQGCVLDEQPTTTPTSEPDMPSDNDSILPGI